MNLLDMPWLTVLCQTDLLPRESPGSGTVGKALLRRCEARRHIFLSSRVS